MITGTKKWQDESIRYIQTNAIIERFLADLKTAKQVSFWLESCNVSAACCGVESVGGEWKVRLPALNGKNILSQKDIMFGFLYSDLGGKWKNDGICENEVAENIVYAVNQLSTAKAKLIKTISATCVESIISSLKKGNACELSYTTRYGGGHYICLVAYDDDTKEFIYYNSWPEDPENKNNGIKERFSFDFIKNKIRNNQYIEITA